MNQKKALYKAQCSVLRDAFLDAGEKREIMDKLESLRNSSNQNDPVFGGTAARLTLKNRMKFDMKE